MQLNNPQLFQVSISLSLDDPYYHIIDNKSIVLEDTLYLVYKKTIDYLTNTATYFLLFSNSMTQTSFFKALPSNVFSYHFYGLVHLDSPNSDLGDYVNG